VFVKRYMILEKIEDASVVFCFRGGSVLINTDDQSNCLPLFRDVSGVNGDLSAWHYLGEWDGVPCCCVAVDANVSVPDGYDFRDLRPLYSAVSLELWRLAGYARQVVDWGMNFRYCGRCGRETSVVETERARVCDHCGLFSYPRISPAMIVTVVRDGTILLARSVRFKGPFYSVLAGFVEPGESLEECVAREVREEVGIEIENIRYFQSQSWPFPDSLMVAFFADYKSGEIVIDPVEIVHAGWFAPDDLPEIPPPGSVSRKMIDEFRSIYGKAD